MNCKFLRGLVVAVAVTALSAPVPAQQADNPHVAGLLDPLAVTTWNNFGLGGANSATRPASDLAPWTAAPNATWTGDAINGTSKATPEFLAPSVAQIPLGNSFLHLDAGRDKSHDFAAATYRFGISPDAPDFLPLVPNKKRATITRPYLGLSFTVPR